MGSRLAAVALLLGGLAVAPADAADPQLTVTASPTSGAAPLAVSLAAAPGANAYRWDFGDGATGTGRQVQHTYAEPAAYAAVVTAEYAGGVVQQATVVVTAFRLSLDLPASARYGARMRVRASLAPALVGVPLTLFRGSEAIATARTSRSGTATFAARALSPGPYAARFGAIPSAERSLLVRPVLDVRVVGSRVVREPLRLVAALKPAAAGRLHVQIRRNGRLTHSEVHGAAIRLGLRTRRAASFRILVTTVAAPGWASATRALRTRVVRPRLALGSRGPAVRELERRLAELRYVLPRVDGRYGLDTYQAVLAFQKVGGLPWTGRVDPRTWRTLMRARTPMPRYRGTHIEVSKGRQYLYVVRSSRVTAVVHVSTGATGNTPLGRWHVYRKVVGWDWVLWYPMYFLRGFAIHGYPLVPSYPASHGCVRVPMWIAPRLYAQHAYGATVYVY